MASTARVRMKRRVTANAAAQALNLPEERGTYVSLQAASGERVQGWPRRVLEGRGVQSKTLQEKITPGPCLPPARGPPLRRASARPHHSQLLVVLICKVAEPSRVEEELGRVLQQEQDQAQAAQAVETQTSLTVPTRHRESGGQGAWAPLSTPALPASPASSFRIQICCHTFKNFP